MRDLSKVAEMPRGQFADWLLKELWRAYYDARKGKRTTVDEHMFEINAAENILNLRDVIMSGYYRPGRGIAFIVWRPVTREIFAAPFKDRVVHHFLYNMVAEWWDKRLIYDAYSCRKEKGVLFGVQRIQHHINSVSQNYEKKAYVIKLDIQGYFMSLPREGLMERVEWGLKRQFPERGQLYQTLMELWAAVIFDDPCKGVIRKGSLADWDCLPRNKSLFCQPPGQGIVIGNLSSQLLSNIYLDPMDRFIMHDLGYKHYGRYVDDFYIIVPEEKVEQVKQDIMLIRDYLAMRKLTLHPKKVQVIEVHQGVEWLGAMVWKWGLCPGRRMEQFFREAAELYLVDDGDVTSIASYLGHMKHLRSKKVEKKIFDRMGWEYRF